MDKASTERPMEREIATLRELTGSADAVCEIIDEYVELATQLVATAEVALAAGDARGLELAAHSLKGSSGMIGAHAVRLAAEAVERAAAAGDLSEARAKLPAVIEGHRASIAGLRELRGEQRA